MDTIGLCVNEGWWGGDRDRGGRKRETVRKERRVERERESQYGPCCKSKVNVMHTEYCKHNFLAIQNQTTLPWPASYMYADPFPASLFSKPGFYSTN